MVADVDTKWCEGLVNRKVQTEGRLASSDELTPVSLFGGRKHATEDQMKGLRGAYLLSTPTTWEEMTQ